MPQTAPLKNPVPLKTPTDQRSGEILAAARAAFSEKGFDGASMQDLARAAGISVGNFYRYFPSKSAIVHALIAADIADMEASFSVLSASSDPRAALRAELKHRVETGQACDQRQIWSEINAAAHRNPDIAHPCAEMEAKVSIYLRYLFSAISGLPLAEVTARFSAQADFIMMLVRAAIMLRPLNPATQGALNDQILTTIDQILDDVAAARVKG